MATQQARKTTAVTIPPRRASTNDVPVQKPYNAKQLLALALGGASLTLNIPPEATLPQVEEHLGIAVESYKTLGEAMDRVRPMIGYLIVEVEKRKLYRPEYKNITDYIERFIEGKLKLARQTGFDLRRIAMAFPSVNEEDFARYGASRLLEAAKETNEQDPNHRELLNTLLTMTVQEGREFLAARRATSNEPATTKVVSVRIPSTEADAWDAFVKAQGQSAADVFVAMFGAYRAAVESANDTDS